MMAMATGAAFEDEGAELVARLERAVADIERERQQRAGLGDGSTCKLGIAADPGQRMR